MTSVLTNSVTLIAGTQYYFLWFYGQGGFTTAFNGASTFDPTPASPFGSLYSGLIVYNNSSVGMTKTPGIQTMYMILGLGAGSNPNGGYSATGTLATYTFKMQTVLQAIQAVIALAPANWYWYVDPGTGVLNFALSNTTPDVRLVKGVHLNELDIEATKESIKNTVYFTGGDDGTATNTNILVKKTTTQGTNRKGLVLLSDNRVNSTTGGTVTAGIIAINYLANNANETYITNVTIQDMTMDVNLVKLGKMIAISGLGNFVDALLLQVVGVNRQADQLIAQLGTLPMRTSQQVATIESQLSYQQTVANQSTPS